MTGGAGFIGSHLVDALLKAGAERVVVIDDFFLGKESNLDFARDRFGSALKVYREDAGDDAAMAAIVKAEQPEIVFNLATRALLYSFFNPAGAYQVNVDIALALAELLRAGAYRRLIHVSSSEVYGTAQRVPMDEAHPLLAETSYAAGKAAADLLLKSYVNMFGLDVLTLRPFNTYGPRQNDQALAAIVPLTIKRILDGKPPVIEGDGQQTRDFIFVGDVVTAILKLASHNPLERGLVLNIGSGLETSIETMVRGICGVMNYRGEIERAPARPADVRRHCADVGRARALVGEIAATPRERGLALTVEWYRQRASAV